MPKTHLNFHSSGGKRQILIAEDEMINREMLREYLENDYDLLFAGDGAEALELLAEHRDDVSLLLLDLRMPILSGQKVLERMKIDPLLRHIPVIVMTADQSAEVECLQLGAIDFIPKPYPQPAVVLARLQRTIELSEDQDTIKSTERDRLTDLYNRDYFFLYARQYEQHHKDEPMDVMVININHFRMINERFGKAYGDQVLRRVGKKVRGVVRDSGGIVSRVEADTFLIYCPHREDYQDILDKASVGLEGDDSGRGRIRLRMGVYANVDKTLDMERRFDRAKMAADTVRGNYAGTIAFYDEAMHSSELYAEQLVEDFHTAIEQHQFTVFYQPKFNIQQELPIMVSAEALVRWNHPKYGLISPGVFIPLFEENGLIRELDHYVWREAAAQIREWKRAYDIVVPVSVNVSRIDMYDPNLVSDFQELLTEYDLTASEYLLEITESAYTKDSRQIIETVNQLRSLGFRIEMDDFGTGYSSLNMISTLPIDALKLDMQFIRAAFSGREDTRLIRIILDIARYLDVPVIAEGVETEDQMEALRQMGCEIVQGYYFSRPVPAEEYERFVMERQQIGTRSYITLEQKAEAVEYINPAVAFGRIAHALSSGFESIYDVDTETGHYVEFSSRGRTENLQIQRSGKDFFADTQTNIKRVIHPEDQTRVALSMQKDTLLAQLVGGRNFSLTYRLVLDGKPYYYNLKAVREKERSGRHIVIGVSNVNDQMEQAMQSGELSQRAEDRNQEIFSIAQALSSDFESVYYVNLVTDDYTEFTAQGSYEKLQIELTGRDFFRECAGNIPKVVYEPDVPGLLADMEKKTLLGRLNVLSPYTRVYRLMIDGVPRHYQLKAVRLEEDPEHLVIGVANIEKSFQEHGTLHQVAHETITYSRIAQALAQDYFTICYVNTETDQFMEYTVGGDHVLTLQRTGDHFFTECTRLIPEHVLDEDQERALAAFDKKTILNKVSGGRTFAAVYRLLTGGGPIYASVKVLQLPDDDKHLVVGISNIDAQMRREKEFEEAKAERLTYANIAQALAADYFSIYYVDVVTGNYIEFNSRDEYRNLNIESDGTNFFGVSKENILRIVYPPDRSKVINAMDPAHLMKELEKTGTFLTTYRLVIEGKPTYVSLKASRMTNEEDDSHIVIGISNVDAQMQREAELDAARALANRDALTGVKSKHAYVETEEQFNQEIASGSAAPFAVAVCDLNGLKTVNDTKGHQAGDKYIQDASAIICNIFKHSPVFRIGGDEFVAVLRGSDYEDRAELMERLAQRNRENEASGAVTIAGGLSEYVPGQDRKMCDVFGRADETMYQNKNRMKEETKC